MWMWAHHLTNQMSHFSDVFGLTDTGHMFWCLVVFSQFLSRLFAEWVPCLWLWVLVGDENSFFFIIGAWLRLFELTNFQSLFAFTKSRKTNVSGLPLVALPLSNVNIIVYQPGFFLIGVICWKMDCFQSQNTCFMWKFFQLLFFSRIWVANCYLFFAAIIWGYQFFWYIALYPKFEDFFEWLFFLHCTPDFHLDTPHSTPRPLWPLRGVPHRLGSGRRLNLEFLLESRIQIKSPPGTLWGKIILKYSGFSLRFWAVQTDIKTLSTEIFSFTCCLTSFHWMK